MPALPPVTQCIRSLLGQVLDEDAGIVTRLFWNYSGATSPTLLTDFATNIAAAWHAQMHAQLGDNHALTSVECVDLTTDISPVGSWTGSYAGDSGQPSVPAAITMVIKHLIARRYRGGKPKTFLSGVTSLYQADSQSWTTGGITNVYDQWGAFISQCISGAPGALGDLALVSVSYYQGFTAYENPVTGRYRNIPLLRDVPVQDAITGHALDHKFGSQRRRSLNRS